MNMGQNMGTIMATCPKTGTEVSTGMSADSQSWELLSRYRNQDFVTRLRQVLAGHGRDRPSVRTVR